MVNVQGGYSSAFPVNPQTGKVVSLTPAPSKEAQEILRPRRRQPQSTIQTPTPSAEELTGTPAQKQEQIQRYQAARTISNQFLTETTKQPTGEIISSVSVQPQRLLPVKYTDVTPVLTGTQTEYFEQDGKQYKRTIETYSGGGKTEIGYGVFGDTSQYIEYQNPLGTTSTVKVSPGETIYYNPVGGYGSTTSKVVPSGSFEINIEGQRLFGGKTAEQIYQSEYEQQGYLGKVKATAKSELYGQNFLGLGDLYDLATTGKTRASRIQTALTEQSYSPSGQVKLSTGEIITKSPLFKATIVTGGAVAAFTGATEVAAVVGLPLLARFAPSTFTVASSVISSALSPTVISSVAQPAAAFLVPEYEYKRESAIYKSTGDYGAVIGDVAYQSVALGSGVLGGAAASKVVGGNPFRVSQPEFKKPFQFEVRAVAGGVTPTGNVEKGVLVYGSTEAQFEGSILPPAKREIVAFAEVTELPSGAYVLKPSPANLIESEYSFLTGKVEAKITPVEYLGEGPFSIFNTKSAKIGIKGFEIPEGFEGVRGTKGTVYIRNLETGKLVSAKTTSVSFNFGEEGKSTFLGTTKETGKITAIGTYEDTLGLKPTSESGLYKPQSLGDIYKELGITEHEYTAKEILRLRRISSERPIPYEVNKPIVTFEYEEKSAADLFKPSPTTPKTDLVKPSESTGLQTLQESKLTSASEFSGKNLYERTEGGLSPGELSLRSNIGRVSTGLSGSFEQLASRTKGGFGVPVLGPIEELGTRLRRPQIFVPSDVSLMKQNFQGKFSSTSIIIQTSGQTQRQRQRQEQITGQSELLKETTTQITTTTQPPLIYPKKTTTYLPPFIPGGFTFGETYKYKAPKAPPVLKGRYQASLTSGLLGIKTTRQPRQIKGLGGYGPFRPLVVPSRHRSKKKRR